MPLKILGFEKKFTRKWFINYFSIILGAFIISVGFVYFITPYKFVPGGVYGIAIVVHWVTKGLFAIAPEGIPVGLMGLALDIPLTIIGTRILGPKFGIKTVIGFVAVSQFIMLLTYFQGDKPLVEGDPLLSALFGAVLVGLGIGIMFRSKATSGGSDIIAMIIAKYTHLPVGQLLIYVDSVIVLLGLVVFQDWKIPLYSWLIIFITGKVIDTVIQGLSYEKTLFIISEKHEEIRNVIIHELDRGGTFIMGKGMFNGAEKKIIFTVVSRKELALLKDYVHRVDPYAFMTVLNASEILGEGFKPLKQEE
ncbi:MAG TPA: YitT family protein [Bacteroidales bacterium]|nr:YitT family protein [Bacteroidales bacterium]